jgi:Spy/CpxP family protein refolding chaperone
MKKMKKLALSLMLTAGLVAGSFAAGNENPPQPSNVSESMQNAMRQPQPHGIGRFEDELKRKLNLTDEQANQIREIKRQEMEEVRNFFTRERKSALEEATKNGGFDEDVFVRTSVENAKKVAEIRAKYLKKTLGVLNEEQKKKFIEDLKNRESQKLMMR